MSDPVSFTAAHPDSLFDLQQQQMNDGVLTKTLIWKSYISYVSNMASYILHRRVPVVDMDHGRCEDAVYRLGAPSMLPGVNMTSMG